VCRSTADRLRRGRFGGDEGFSLVEIMIAMVIFGIVATATTPMLLGGLKAGRTAQLNLQAKALGQERLELMRNLPFNVAQQNGLYLDVLDIYHRDLVASGALAAGDTCATRSYEAATSTYVCTITDLGAGHLGFTQVVRTQFLNAERTVIVPIASYSSQVAGRDTPPANLLGVTVATSWAQQGAPHTFTVRSHIANAQADPNVITASVRATALNVTSNLSNEDILQLEGGLLSSEGALTTGSTASLSAVAARAGLASGTSVQGAALSLTAPPAVTGTSPTEGASNLFGSACEFACFGPSSITGNQQVTVASGQPKVSLVGNQVTTTLSRSGLGTFRGFSYTNATTAEKDPALGIVGPMVSGGSVPGDVLATTGYLDATGSGSTAVQSSATVGLAHLELFPTAFAPAGVVQVRLDSAKLTCRSGSGTGGVTAAWSGEVRYWSAAAATAASPTGAYVALPLAPGAAALPAPATLIVQPGVPLSTWLSAWSAATSASAVDESSARRGKGTLSAVLTMLTTPTRPGLAGGSSPINVAVGSVSCIAEDAR